MYLIFLILLPLLGFGASDDYLLHCKDMSTCKCGSPYIGKPINFKIRPDKINISALQCSFDVKNLNNILACIQSQAASDGFSLCPEDDLYSQGPIQLGPFLPFSLCSYDDLIPTPLSISIADSAPKNCGYRWSKVRYISSAYFRAIKSVKDDKQIPCIRSMCTSATFLVFVAHARRQYKQGKISKTEFEKMTDPYGKAYKILNESAEPNRLIETYGLGEGHVFDLSKDKLGKNGVPKIGDLAQLWRKNGRGHSVVFKGLIDQDNDGKEDLFCYWSSQKMTNGYGEVCEKLEEIEQVLVGHFK